jgi:hypothetical protein
MKKFTDVSVADFVCLVIFFLGWYAMMIVI